MDSNPLTQRAFCSALNQFSVSLLWSDWMYNALTNT